MFLPFSASPYSFSRRPHPSSYPDRSWHYGCVLQCCLGCQDHHQRLVGSSSSGVSSIYIDRYTVYIYTYLTYCILIVHFPYYNVTGQICICFSLVCKYFCRLQFISPQGNFNLEVQRVLSDMGNVDMNLIYYVFCFFSQVSKTAPTGEYLTTGSFMIRGMTLKLKVYFGTRAEHEKSNCCDDV